MENNEQPMTIRKTIWSCFREKMEKKVKVLNRTLARNNRPPMTVKFENFRTNNVKFEEHVKGDAYVNDTFCDRLVEVCDMVVTGAPVIVKREDAPYTFIGSVNMKDGVKQVFCPDDSNLVWFADNYREGICDHCGTHRRRNSVHIFRNENTGKVVQIGSKCAAEYFGLDSDSFLSAFGNTFLVFSDGGDDDYMEYTAGGSMAFGFNFVFECVGTLTRGFTKWVKAGVYNPEAPIYENSTVMGIQQINTILESGHGFKFADNSALSVTLEECIAFWEERFNARPESFSLNCFNALKAGYAVEHSLGTFAYAIFAAVNDKVKKAAEAKVAAATVTSPCPFAVGSRATINGEVVTIRKMVVEECYDGYHSDEVEKTVVDFKGDNGTLYHFTTGSQTFYGMKAGDRLTIRGTVGDTKPFKGIPYTRLSRPKVIEKAEVPAA